MPTKTQVLDAIGADCDYESAAARLRVPAGQLYLIATGLPAEGGDTFPPDEETTRPGVLKGSTRAKRRGRATNDPQSPSEEDR